MSSRIQIIQGDITDAPEKYIVHQCNCATRKAKGLAKLIFDKFPYSNVYSEREPGCDQPGSIKICGNGIDQRFVINLFGQYSGGKPRSSQDSKEKRLQYFTQCLESILSISDLESIAFPYKIGCGLAGGNWDQYFSLLEQFSTKTSARVVIYRLDVQ